MRYRPIARQFFLIFVFACLVLGWCGGQNPGLIIAKPSPFAATLTWAEGGQVVTEQFTAPSENQFDETAQAARQRFAEQGATMTAVTRESATTATITAVIGGTQSTRTVTGENTDEMETEIQHAKEEVGSAAPFFSVERRQPYTFTVTTLSQIATFYYFFFFLVLLPLLGLREKPGRVPDTIAKPVLSEQGAA